MKLNPKYTLKPEERMPLARGVYLEFSFSGLGCETKPQIHPNAEERMPLALQQNMYMVVYNLASKLNLQAKPSI